MKKIFFFFILLSAILSINYLINGYNQNEQEYFSKIFSDKNSINYKILIANINLNLKILNKLIIEEREKNIFFSSTGVQILLSLLLNGLKEDTHYQLSSFLDYIDFESNIINQYYKNFITNLNEEKYGGLNIANSLWLNKGSYIFNQFNFKNTSIISKAFIQVCKDYYFASIFETNLLKENGFKLLQNWIKKTTNNKIKNFINKNDLNSDTVLLLINTIYFNNKWFFTFNPKLTKSEDFDRIDGTKIAFDFISFDSPKSLYYYENELLQIVRLPYEGNSKSLVVLLPKNIKDTESFIKNLNSSEFEKIFTKMTKKKGYVFLPKIKSENEYNFKDILLKMGFKKLFEPSYDFEPLFNQNLPGISNFMFAIDKIYQKTYLKIDEEGTTAAAATSVSIFSTATSIQQDIFYFKANHPFIYFLIDDISGNIIFTGYFLGY